ncbi:hypothetical protein ACGFYQ_36945 [Streptomyces sp. NPDC048258]|uniref:hypothetical protein n=1 Tax=Streptomyces sp. NPDC048258 TaxID=3365527 RepID=UPI00371C4B45
MNRSIQKAVHCTILAAALALSAPQAFAASGSDAAGPARQPVASQASAWLPPAGYVKESSFYGTAAACESTGRTGIAEGKWIAYICYQALPFTPFQDLYVKK